MPDHTQLTELALQRLTDDDDTFRRRLVTMWVDDMLARPLSELVDLDATTAQITAGLTGQAVSAWRQRHGDPHQARTRARWRASQETLGTWIPPEAVEKIETLLASDDFPRARWARGAVSPAALKSLLAPALQEVLLGFVKKLSSLGKVGSDEPQAPPTPRASSRFGLRKHLKASVQRRGEQIVGASKTVLDGMNLGVEERFRAAARDFSDTASTTLRRALADRIRSEAGAKIVAGIRSQVFARLLETPLETLAADMDGLDSDTLWEILGLIVDHAGNSDVFAEIVAAEVAEGLRAEGMRPLAEIIAEAGDLALFRETLIAQGTTLAGGLFATDQFRAWMSDLLKPA